MTLTAGTLLGPYEVISPLGAGGMGEVYRARDTRLGPRRGDQGAAHARSPRIRQRLKRFERRRASASSLNHPNIVTIYEIGQSDSVSYIAMELVDGAIRFDRCFWKGALPVRRILLTSARDRRGSREGARRLNRASRPEARERDGDRGRSRQDPRLRPREADAAGLDGERPAAVADGRRRHRRRRHPRNRGLHVSRAGDAGRPIDYPVGSVLLRLDSLRDGDRSLRLRWRPRLRRRWRASFRTSPSRSRR